MIYYYKLSISDYSYDFYLLIYYKLPLYNFKLEVF